LFPVIAEVADTIWMFINLVKISS